MSCKKAIFGLVLVSVCLWCSGCLTILGGIIGHQSGEMAAGLAIGAGIEFGGAIIKGVGDMLGGDKGPRVVAYTDEGYVRLRRGCDQRQILRDLQEKMRHNGWECEGNPDVPSTKRMRSEIWHCAAAGTDFDLEIISEKGQDTRLYVRMTDVPPNVTRRMITSGIVDWLRQIVGE